MCGPIRPRSLYLAVHDDFRVTMHFPVGMKPSETWFKQRNHSTHRLNQYPISLISIHETSRGLRAIPGQKHLFLPGVAQVVSTSIIYNRRFRPFSNDIVKQPTATTWILSAYISFCGTNCATLAQNTHFRPGVAHNRGRDCSRITPGHLRTPAEPTTMSEPRLAQGKVGKTAQQQHLPTHVEDPHGPRLGHTAARTHDVRAGSCGRKGLS